MALDSKVENAIQQIFVGLLGRPVAEQGLAYWTEQVNNGFGLEEVMANIVNEQPEYLEAFEGLTRAEAVTLHFQQLFGRAPTLDAEGNNYWINGEGAEVPVDELVLALINGAQGNDVVALDNRVIVANAYTRAAAESGTFDIEAGKELLVGVNHTNTSVADALEKIDTVTFNLPEALEQLAAAQEAKADFLAELEVTADAQVEAILDSAVIAFNGDANATTTVTSTSTAGQVTAAITIARENAATAIANAQTTLGAANADVDAVAGLRAKVTAYDDAQAAEQQAGDALGAAKTAEGGAIGAYNVNNTEVLPSQVAFAGGVVTLTGEAENLFELNDAGNALVLIDDVTEQTNPGVSALLEAINGRLAAEFAEQAASDAVDAAWDAMSADEQGLYDALETARTGVSTAESDADKLEGLIADLQEGYELVEQMDILNGAVEAIEEAIEVTHKINIEYLDGATTGTSSEADVFIFTGEDATLAANEFEVANDSIYIGGEYTLVAIGEGQSIASNLGSATALEIFWQETGGDLVLYVENVAAAGNGTTDVDMGVITLTGVSMDDLDFANGMLVA